MGALEGKTRQSKRIEEGSFNSISRDKYKNTRETENN